MQNILDVKQKLETQAKNEFAIASAAVREEEEKLNTLNKRQVGYQDYLRSLQNGTLNFKDIKETADAIEALKYIIDDQKIELKRVERVLEMKRVALADAVLEVKTHEKLKEKEFRQFMADEAAKESKEIDELVSYRFGQKEDE